MKELEATECYQIRYHITYDENLTFKDLEDLLKLIRLSTNDILQEIGVSRSDGNDMQKIASIYPGSINLIAFLKEVISIGTKLLTEKLVDKIQNRIEEAAESCKRNPKLDKSVCCKHRVKVKFGKQTISVESNAPIINIEIEIHNGEDK